MKIYRSIIYVALSLFLITLPRCSSCSADRTTMQTKAQITTTTPAETTTEATTEPTTAVTTTEATTEATTTETAETTTETTAEEPQNILDEPRKEYKIYSIRYEMAESWDYSEQAENRQVFTIKNERDSLGDMAFCHVLVNNYTEGSGFPDVDESQREALAQKFCEEFKEVNKLRTETMDKIEVLGDTAYSYTLYFEEEDSDLPLYFAVIYLPDGALNIAFYYPELETGKTLYDELLDSLVAEVDVIDLDVLVQDDEDAIDVEEAPADDSNDDATNEPQGNVGDIPDAYRPAFEVADDYLNGNNLSKQGLYDLLVSPTHGFAAEAAQYVVDHLDVDWNYFALQRAKQYANEQFMSKLAIYDILIADYGDKFTQEEARYAVENVDADWNNNALQIALSYKNDLNMAPDKIYEQLISEYGERFTPEEAQYAIDHLD